jgi:hypothetical protein
MQESRREKVHLQIHIPVSTSILMLLCTLLGLASKAAHKNERIEMVLCEVHGTRCTVVTDCVSSNAKQTNSFVVV